MRSMLGQPLLTALDGDGGDLSRDSSGGTGNRGRRSRGSKGSHPEINVEMWEGTAVSFYGVFLKSSFHKQHQIRITDIEFRQKVGKGQFGSVYEGAYKAERVAVKALWVSKPEELDQLANEVKRQHMSPHRRRPDVHFWIYRAM